MFCPHCGKEITEGQLFCQHCGGRITETVPNAGGREKTPWEDRETHGFLGGIFKTVKESLFAPSAFFRKMPVTGGLADPLLYALIVGMVSTMVSYVWQILFQGTMQSYIPAEMRAAPGYDMFQGLGIAVLAVVVPIFIILWLFIWSGIVHLCLMMVKGAKAGFEATFRAVAYSNSAYLFMVIPICGSLITAIWSMVLIIIGLKEAHETSGGKAAFAELFPLALCCGLIVAVVVLGIMAASLGTMSRISH